MMRECIDMNMNESIVQLGSDAASPEAKCVKNEIVSYSVGGQDTAANEST